MSAQSKYVFISYSRMDQERVLPIVERLRQSGVTAWIDQEGIDGASFWAEEIVNAIRGCTVFLFMISENSVDSSHTNRELALAAERNLPILPIYLSRAELPARTAYQLAGIHYIEMFDGPTERAVKTVLHALQRAGIELAASPLRPGAGLVSEPRRAAPGPPGGAPAQRPSTDPLPPPAQIAPAPSAGVPDEVARLVEGATFLRETPMSRLYRGRRESVGDVVLKVMLQLPPESEEWLRSNAYAQVMGTRLIEVGRLASGEMWVLTRYIDAVPLSSLVRAGNVVVGALLDDLVVAVMEALAVLHGQERPVIHRDVTPGNLMLTFEDPEAGGTSARASFTVHLIDYEAACFAGSRQTPVGAPGFAPPEQIGGQAVLSSDLYSLVATAYFLATADLPPNLARPGESPVMFPRGVWGNCTRLDLRYGHGHFVRCWASDPQKRPLSAGHFLAHVEVPGTRMISAERPLGVFACGEDRHVVLTDQGYSVKSTPR
jgi:hypothetical protein